MSISSLYTGRFAPSPTGPLHFGSLLTAVASYIDAKSSNGKWLVRMDDLDQPRCITGADSDILRTIEAYGMHWDGEVMYQSQRRDAYEAALDELQRNKLVYSCSCSRKEIANIAQAGIDGMIYPGTCRDGQEPGRETMTVRVRTTTQSIAFHDRIQGEIFQNLEREVGDFIIRRADGLFAYQLAVVVDDADQGITDIVRGCDLIDSTARQIWLQQLLHYPVPRYAHLPIAVNTQGQKLSKQTHARPANREKPLPTLHQIMQFLNQEICSEMRAMSLREFWDEAIARWQPGRIPTTRQLPAPLD